MVDKNKRKEKVKQNRVWFDMRLGTQTHHTPKHPDRAARKKEMKKLLDNY